MSRLIWVRKARNWMASRKVLMETRRHLRRLTDHQLKDIGISRHEALTESRKPFWKS